MEGSGKEIKQVYHYLFKKFCFEKKIVTVPYFNDEMPLYEVDDIIDNLRYTNMDDWECARLVAWTQARTTCKNIPKNIEEFIPLPVDESEEEIEEKAKHVEQTTGKSDIERMKRLSNKWR